MESITIRNLDDDVKKRLRECVAAHRRSMEDARQKVARLNGPDGSNIWGLWRKS